MCSDVTKVDRTGNVDDPPASQPRAARVVRHVSRNEAKQLVVHLDGQDEAVVDAHVARCFPWSLPGAYVSIRDKEGKELVLLKTLDELDPPSRRVVEEELADKIFNPKIHRVTDHRSEFGVISITAETDRGEVTFQIRSRDDVRMLSDTRALFRDADGNTYELEDVTQLDAASRKSLEDYF